MSIFKIIDIDTILLKLLLVDDLRNLYRINRYYRNLIKPLLADYIYFYSNIKHIDFFDMNDGLFLESVKYGRIHVCKYNYVKFTPTTIYAGLSSSEIITQTILEYGFKKACEYGHHDIAKWIHEECRILANKRFISTYFDDFAYAHFNVLLERYQKN